MYDLYQRTIEYLRISVTDRCNLRCRYCMPESGVESLHHSDILSYEEIVRLVRCASSLGVRKVRLTGGEPLVRRGIADLVSSLKALDGIEEVTITTNGILLKEQLKALTSAGLDGVNISLDTLDPNVFQKISRRDHLQQVLEGIQASLSYEQLRVKLNCVPVKGVNEAELTAIAALARDQRLSVRFIEMMPIGLGKEFDPIPEIETRKWIEQQFGRLIPLDHTAVKGGGPAVYYRPEGFVGSIGFISAVSHQFCDHCNRVRLSADGYLKTCLQFEDGVDLKRLLRDPQNRVSDTELTERIALAIRHKPKEHQFQKLLHEQEDWKSESGTESCQEHLEQKQMNRIGG